MPIREADPWRFQYFENVCCPPDIDIPTEPGNSKSTPQSVKEAVLAAFHAGAPGVVLSRKFSEMRLSHLSGAGEAIRELKLSG